MVKKIKVMKNGQADYVYLTKDDMLKMFDKMFLEFSYKCVTGLSGYKGSVDGFDDYKQLAMMKACDLYNKYDVEKNACFSRFLFNGFRNLYVDLLKEQEAKKRKAEVIIYLDKAVDFGNGSSSEIHDVVMDKHVTIEDQLETGKDKLEKFLLNNLTKEEIIFYTMDLKKQYGKASKMQKMCLEDAINMFSSEVGEFTNRKDELAIQLGMSRPTLNKKIKETTEKVKELTRQYCITHLEIDIIDF